MLGKGALADLCCAWYNGIVILLSSFFWSLSHLRALRFSIHWFLTTAIVLLKGRHWPHNMSFQQGMSPQSLDTDVQRPFYSVAIVALLPFLNMGRERRWPRWIKKASHIGSKRLCMSPSIIAGSKDWCLIALVNHCNLFEDWVYINIWTIQG